MDTITTDARTNSRITAAYREHTPGSADLAKEAGELFPSGITHDARNVDPYGVYIARAEGPHKWDVDGHRYIDYFGGHGALLLGHRHPVVSKAVSEAMNEGTQFGARCRPRNASASRRPGPRPR
jgi:glutamate-1-semialdehyde 2,1-aminomutase